ncbi:hypothetical protein [Achromobacter kerstersii]|uniref:hypothetical protein n=1 Tax=Achromobacter kerstersii TaxID=1353890 RepID=UPI003CFF6BA5
MAQKKVGGAAARRLLLRNTLWPDLSEDLLWIRTEKVGFTTMPRVMPLLGRIMDQLSGKGAPVYATYLALWCRVFDEAFVEVRSTKELAFESGFNGTRGEVTWKERMRRLQSIGLIDVKAGLINDFQYVLLLNPIIVVVRLFKESERDDRAFSALIARLIEIGADDVDVAMQLSSSAAA